MPFLRNSLREKFNRLTVRNMYVARNGMTDRKWCEVYTVSMVFEISNGYEVNCF